MINTDLFVQCARCRLCEGAQYQTIPTLCAGSLDAPILVIGQNPGEIKPNDEHRNWWMHDLRQRNETLSWNEIEMWYRWDFGTSYGHEQLERLFGLNWISTDDFLFTNAVKCRTKDNAKPSQEMITACRSWTKFLVKKRRAIILMGTIARQQLLGEEEKKVPWGIIKRHPKYGPILAIKHYAAWKDLDEFQQYKKAVKSLKEKVLND